MSKAYRVYVLVMLVVVYTFNFIDRVIVAILAQPIKVELELSDTQLGLMSGAAFAVFYTLLGIPIARLADRHSRVWIMTGALALWSGFTALCGQAQSFAQLFAARIGVGVGEAGGVAPAYSLVSDYFPPAQRARALAVFSFGIPLGSGLGTLLGGLVASAVNWRAAFVVVGIAGLVLAPIFRLTVREPLRGGLDEPPRSVLRSSLADVLRLLSRKPAFLFLSLGTSCASIVGYGLLFWLPSFFIRSHGLSLSQTAWIIGVATILCGITGIWLGGWAGDRMGSRSKAAYALLPAVLLSTIVPFLVAGALAPTLTISLLLFIVPLTLTTCWAGPVLSALQHLVAPEMRATASACWAFINNLIGIGGGTLIVGALSDLLVPRFGVDSLRYAIVIASAFYFLSSAFFYGASRHLAKDWHG